MTPALLLPVAHAVHWALYGGPVIVVLAAVFASAVRERQARERAEDEGERDRD